MSHLKQKHVHTMARFSSHLLDSVEKASLDTYLLMLSGLAHTVDLMEKNTLLVGSNYCL